MISQKTLKVMFTFRFPSVKRTNAPQWIFSPFSLSAKHWSDEKEALDSVLATVKKEREREKNDHNNNYNNKNSNDLHLAWFQLRILPEFDIFCLWAQECKKL